MSADLNAIRAWADHERTVEREKYERERQQRASWEVIRAVRAALMRDAFPPISPGYPGGAQRALIYVNLPALPPDCQIWPGPRR